jgi:uncharacterized membrane protein YfcA
VLIYLQITGIFLAAGFIQGVTGFGSALVAIPLLTLFLDIKTAIPLCALNGLVITILLTVRLQDHIDRQKILPLLFGSLPGIAVGAFFLKKADPVLMKILLGCLLVAYGCYRLLGRPGAGGKKIDYRWSYAAGFVTGLIGGAFAAGGPPVIIYTTLTGWSKDVIKATLSGFFLASTLFIVAAHALTGLTTVPVLSYFAVAMPGVLIGVLAGAELCDRVDTDNYLRLLFLCLLGLGIMMLAASF